MAGVTPPSDSDIGGDRVIITSPEAVDMKKAVNDHFQRSIECAMATLSSGGGQQSPRQWPGRNLPEAFFSKPPSSTKSKTSSNTPLSHSRDGSTDSSGRYTLSPPATATSLSPLVQHSRTHSSPAIISNVQAQTNYSPTSSQPTNPSNLIQHQKHRSFDNTLDTEPSMQHLWQQNQYGHQVQQPLCQEKTSKSLGDLATPIGMGMMDTGFPNMQAAAAAMDAQYGDQHARKTSCNDPSVMWGDYASGQNFQKPQNQNQSQFMRQQPRHSTSVPSGSVRSQIMKRQQQQQQLQYQQQCQLQQGHAGANAYANPVVQELNQERQRMYERNMQLRQQGLLDPLPTATLPISPAANQYQSDLTPSQYQFATSSNAPRTHTNPQYQHQHQYHARQGSSDSGLEMQAYTAYTPYMRQQQDMDLNFANITLDPNSLMDVDPSVIPAGPLDIAPDDLDQYLNH